MTTFLIFPCLFIFDQFSPLKFSFQKETERNVENRASHASPVIQIQMPINLYCLSLYLSLLCKADKHQLTTHLCVLSCQLFFFSQMRSTQRFITPASSLLPTLHLCASWFWRIFKYATSSGASRCVHQSYLFHYKEAHQVPLLSTTINSAFPTFDLTVRVYNLT